MDIGMVILICVIFLTITLIPIIWMVRSRDKRMATIWKEFASRHRLHYDSGGSKSGKPVIRGALNGHPFCLDTFLHSGGSGTGVVTRITLSLLKSPPLRLNATHPYATGLTPSGDPKNQINTNDKQFDKKIILTGGPVTDVVRYLTPERKRHLVLLLEKGGAFQLKDGKISLLISGLIVDSPKLEKTITGMLKSAKVLEPTISS